MAEPGDRAFRTVGVSPTVLALNGAWPDRNGLISLFWCVPMRFPSLTFAAACMVAACAAGAQTPPPTAKQACRSSAMALCPDEAKSGDRAAIRACLIKNYEKVTPECQAAMKAAQAQEQAAKPDAPPPKP